MKELIEQAREAIDSMDDYARMAGVEAVGPLKVLNECVVSLGQQAQENDRLCHMLSETQNEVAEQAKQIEELAAALAGKDEALGFCWRDVPMNEYAFDIVDKALTLQPHASLVAKIKADAVREWASYEENGGSMNAYEYADRIERGEVK